MARRAPNWVYTHARAGSRSAEETLAFWREFAPMLEKDGRLTAMDVPAFTRLATSYGLMMDAAQTLAVEGLTMDVPKGLDRGSEKRHPAALVYTQNEAIVRAGFAEFLMTPASRSKHKAPDVSPERPGDDLLD